MQRRQGGVQGVTDNSHDVIGEDVAIQDDHTRALNKTKKQEDDVNTRKTHRRCLNQMMAFWEKDHPAYFELDTGGPC